MKKQIISLGLVATISSSLLAYTYEIKEGWQLLGAIEDITDLSIFNDKCIDYMWKYNTNDTANPEWNLHIANGVDYDYCGKTLGNLNKGDGFWVKANSDCNITIGATCDTLSDIPTPENIEDNCTTCDTNTSIMTIDNSSATCDAGKTIAIATNYNSCKSILDASKAIGDGNYKLTLDTLGEKTVYCDMTNGGYTWPYDDACSIEKTKLLVQSNTINGSNTFKDSSTQQHIITSYQNTIHSTANSKFGSSSIYFDGSSDYLDVVYSNDWNFDSNDFTIDFWFNNNSWTQSPSFLGTHIAGTGGNGWLIASDTPDIIKFYTQNTSLSTSGQNLSTGTWYHVAITNKNGTYYHFINGNLVKTIANTTSTNSSNSLRIGTIHKINSINYTIDGYMDEIRIVKGVAKWTTNFTPPTLPYKFK
jgi:hypothetical protein